MPDGLPSPYVTYQEAVSVVAVRIRQNPDLDARIVVMSSHCFIQLCQPVNYLCWDGFIPAL